MGSIEPTIPGYAYGASGVSPSPVSLQELQALRDTVGLSGEDEHYLRMAGDVLADQTRQIVERWRSQIISGIPNLARHTRTPNGQKLPEYLERSNRRFEQWILDTCRRPYDQDWLNYQHEIALRHASLKKNKTDRVDSTPYVPLRDTMAFIVVMNESIKPYFAAKGHTIAQVNRMYWAWCKSLQLQIALWTRSYGDVHNEW